MKTLEEIDTEIDEVSAKIRPLRERLYELNELKRTLESVAWIKANGVTIDQIERERDADRWLGHIDEFAKYLRAKKDRKRFCSWNGALMHTAEVIGGKYQLNGPGRIEDVPGFTN